MKSKKLTKILFFIVIMLLGYYGYNKNLEFKSIQFGVKKDDALYKAFIEKFPDKKVIKTAKKDINNDKKEDLTVIYRDEKEDKSYMVIVISKKNGVIFSDKLLAPYENHRIEFKDIDNKPPLEFIVSGSRRGRYGYGIFRLGDKDHIHNIFAEGMNLC